MNLRRNFDQARTECKLFPGGDLAMDNTSETNDRLTQMTELSTRYWIGLKNTKGHTNIVDYQWLATGQNVTSGQQFWIDSYYNTLLQYECICGSRVLLSLPFSWRSFDCDRTLKFICQRPFDVIGSTLTFSSATSDLISSSDLGLTSQSNYQSIPSTLANQISITATDIINKFEFTSTLHLTDESSQVNILSLIISNNIAISSTITNNEIQTSNIDTFQSSDVHLAFLLPTTSKNVKSPLTTTAMKELWLSNDINSQFIDFDSISLSLELSASIKVSLTSSIEGLHNSDFSSSQSTNPNLYVSLSSLVLSDNLDVVPTSTIDRLHQSDFNTFQTTDPNLDSSFISSVSLANVNLSPTSTIDGLHQSNNHTFQSNDLNSSSLSLALSAKATISPTTTINKLQQSDFINFIDDNSSHNLILLPSVLPSNTNNVSSITSPNQLEVLASGTDFSIASSTYQVTVASSLSSVFHHNYNIFTIESTTVYKGDSLSLYQYSRDQNLLSTAITDSAYNVKLATNLMNELDSITDISNPTPSKYNYIISFPDIIIVRNLIVFQGSFATYRYILYIFIYLLTRSH